MKILSCLFSNTSVGGTFIDWSLYFLSGQTSYYNVSRGTLLPVTDNPLSGSTAHGHKKNHPPGFKKTQSYFEKFLNSGSNADFFSVYSHRILISKTKKILNLDVINSQTIKTIKEYQRNDTMALFDWCAASDIKLIYLSSAGLSPLYFLKPRDLGFFLNKPIVPSTQQELDTEFEENFYQDSVDRWKSLNLTEIWDIRERMALDLRPFSTDALPLGNAHKHLRLNCRDVWTRSQSIIEILNYLNLTVNKEKIKEWKQIYQQWQSTQFNHLKFSYCFDDIVDSIVNNWYLEIDLTFQEEVVVQHALIYKHGLNLKTWKLVKFPNNTKELHKLLEPNIHPVESIYQDL